MIGNIKKIKSIKFNYNLGKKTWFGTGGNCTLFFLADSINHLKMILRITKRLIPILVIGSGSNILVRDGGFKGIGIKLGKDFRKIELDKQNFTVSVGSGVKDSEFSKFCLQEEICGFEFLSGIPGTIGGNLKMNAGVTMMDVYSVQGGVRERQVLTERFTGTWSIGYNFDKIKMSVNYTGNIYSPMDLPTQTTDGFIDPRPAQSPWFSIQNIQVTKEFGERIEVYGGLKNLLNWTPWNSLNGVPYLGNTADPFEQNTPPNSLVFDPAYVYGPNQGIRGFLGIRYTLD